MNTDTTIRVVKAAEVEWPEASRSPEETDPPGKSLCAYENGPFSVGLWHRDVQRRSFEREYDEICFIAEGQVEITTENGEVLVAGPGDVLVTPKGSKGYWRNLEPAKKVWACFEY